MTLRDRIIALHLRLDGLALGVARDMGQDVNVLFASLVGRLADARRKGAEVDPGLVATLRSELAKHGATLTGDLTLKMTDALDAVLKVSPIALAEGFEDEGEDPSPVLAQTGGLGAVLGFAQDGRTWPEWTARMAQRSGQRAGSDVSLSPDPNEERTPIDQIGARLERTRGILTTALSALAATAVVHVANRARAFMLRRSRPFRFWTFDAVLDTRTSAICRGLSGTIHRFDDPGAPYPPRHPNCRSIVMPIRDPAEGLIRQNYEEWLRDQPRATQLGVLGPRRFTAWRRGLPLSDMATAERPITVRELRTLYPDRFRGAA